MQNKIKKILNTIHKKTLPVSFMFLLALPASTNYKLNGFGIGVGGEDNATSTNYAADVIGGENGSNQLSSTNYKAGAGLSFELNANVPGAPTFTNPANYYNKLHIVLNTGSNPTDTKFAIAISTDNFAADTRYVQSDNAVGVALGIEDYQTYATWGGASGFDVIGLQASTTYYVKVKAMQGKFTESGYGPVANVATVSPTLSFGININTINFGNLNAGTVVDAPQSVVVSFATNGASGGKVYLVGKNGGLMSPSKSYTISSASGDLAVLAKGFGAQGTNVTQTSGGPLSIVAPYNVSANNVGVVDSAMREIFAAASPLVGGQGTFLLKAKSSALTPAANDYAETLTVLASGNF